MVLMKVRCLKIALLSASLSLCLCLCLCLSLSLSTTHPHKNKWINIPSHFCNLFFFSFPFNRLTVVEVSFCSLIKGITPKIRMLCFVLINSVILNVLCVLILFWSVTGVLSASIPDSDLLFDHNLITTAIKSLELIIFLSINNVLSF